jgi:hypothetical protein
MRVRRMRACIGLARMASVLRAARRGAGAAAAHPAAGPSSPAHGRGPHARRPPSACAALSSAFRGARAPDTRALRRAARRALRPLCPHPEPCSCARRQSGSPGSCPASTPRPRTWLRGRGGGAWGRAAGCARGGPAARARPVPAACERCTKPTCDASGARGARAGDRARAFGREGGERGWRARQKGAGTKQMPLRTRGRAGKRVGAGGSANVVDCRVASPFGAPRAPAAATTTLPPHAPIPPTQPNEHRSIGPRASPRHGDAPQGPHRGHHHALHPHGALGAVGVSGGGGAQLAAAARTPLRRRAAPRRARCPLPSGAPLPPPRRPQVL